LGSPLLVDELHVEDGIYSFAVNQQGTRIAIGTKGMIGIYQIEVLGGMKYLRHCASYQPEEEDREERVFTALAFTAQGRLVCTEFDGFSSQEFMLDADGHGMLEKLVPSRGRPLLALRGRLFRLMLTAHESELFAQ
jgi:hypothetical protein